MAGWNQTCLRPVRCSPQSVVAGVWLYRTVAHGPLAHNGRPGQQTHLRFRHA